ncbi:hypothetical protein LP417_25325 [Polaromonas sp. P1-6]|nr:hypothetical protein LP417_25325 [Polaromonas sp. P1-6]UUZ70650.1 hypothetical protein LP416_05565 [Polaromonas sp. P2-4]
MLTPHVGGSTPAALAAMAAGAARNVLGFLRGQPPIPLPASIRRFYESEQNPTGEPT